MDQIGEQIDPLHRVRYVDHPHRITGGVPQRLKPDRCGTVTPFACFVTDHRGSALIEFAILLPLLLMTLLGIVCYGQYFFLAHSAQQLANDAARATVAGLTSTERRALAEASVTRDKSVLPEAAKASVSIAVEEAADQVIVRVRLDASGLSLVQASILPMPDTVIERRAVTRPGGVT